MGAINISPLLGLFVLHVSAVLMGSAFARGGGCPNGKCHPITGRMKPECHFTHVHCDRHNVNTGPMEISERYNKSIMLKVLSHQIFKSLSSTILNQYFLCGR